MVEFERFDRRRYRTVSVREGYGRWQSGYENTVHDLMDLALLDRLEEVSWADVTYAVDLGCGSGRTAAWLTARGAEVIDGVDVTPEMLDQANERGHHRRVIEADVRSTGLPADAYELAVCSLVDEHLPELDGLYFEARRLLRHPGAFVLVGYHPFFLMGSGMPTHFEDADGESTAIETHVHLFSDHVTAARTAGFAAGELVEGVIDDDWLEHKPQWGRFRDWPISFAWVWHTMA